MHLIFVQRHLLSKELFVCVALGKFQNQDICAYSSSQSEPIRDLHNDGLWWDVTFQFNQQLCLLIIYGYKTSENYGKKSFYQA